MKVNEKKINSRVPCVSFSVSNDYVIKQFLLPVAISHLGLVKGLIALLKFYKEIYKSLLANHFVSCADSVVSSCDYRISLTNPVKPCLILPLYMPLDDLNLTKLIARITLIMQRDLILSGSVWTVNFYNLLKLRSVFGLTKYDKTIVDNVSNFVRSTSISCKINSMIQKMCEKKRSSLSYIHGDFHRGNIMMSTDINKIFIIDWANSGWTSLFPFADIVRFLVHPATPYLEHQRECLETLWSEIRLRYNENALRIFLISEFMRRVRSQDSITISSLSYLVNDERLDLQLIKKIMSPQRAN